ncbi:pyruvate kinase [Pasteurella canis]|uniref:pyruvate kinase n=1 Tax=Pasteurella canis TaxID=753 RepID=UPI001F331986|nr:pyruvate kinase [Pasteurella canis]
MKEFDLEKALAGEPIFTRDHQKGYVKFTIEENSKIKKLVGIVHNGCLTEVEEWLQSGNVLSDDITPNDIIGMWEEPRPTVTLTLPCPLKDVAIGDEIYILSGYSYQNNGVPEVLVRKHNNSTEFFNAINFGLVFKTKEEAEAWLYALKNSRK